MIAELVMMLCSASLMSGNTSSSKSHTCTTCLLNAPGEREEFRVIIHVLHCGNQTCDINT